MKKMFFLIQLFLVPIIGFSQKVAFSIETGINVSSLRIVSKIPQFGDEMKYFPLPGLGFGVAGKFHLNDQLYFYLPFNFDQRNILDKSKYYISDEYSQPVGVITKLVSFNSYLNSGPVLFYRKNNFSFGTGVLFHYLVTSKLIGSSLKMTIPNSARQGKGIIANNIYKKVLFSIPIQANIDVNRSYFFARLDIGVVSRIREINYFKEYENSLLFGWGYRLSK